MIEDFATPIAAGAKAKPCNDLAEAAWASHHSQKLRKVFKRNHKSSKSFATFKRNHIISHRFDEVFMGHQYDSSMRGGPKVKFVKFEHQLKKT